MNADGRRFFSRRRFVFLGGFRVLVVAIGLVPGLLAQLSTGFVEGTLGGAGGAPVLIEGGAGFRLIRSEAYEVQPNLQDFFLYSGKYRPDVYLKPEVRHGISTFALFGDPEEIETGCKKLAGDISTGRFDNVARSFVHSLGDYMFVVAGADGLP